MIDNRYKVLQKLGAGAMGEVYKVEDLMDKRTLALKVLSKQRTTSEQVQRFKREFKLLAGLSHPNLCPVYDFGILKDGQSYFTMEYIRGRDILQTAQGLSFQVLYPWVVQLCRVLEYIHAKGLIHYDLKPSNVLVQMVNNEAVIKLMDFGLAGEQYLKGGLAIKGTFPYIAPELIKGLAVDHRADLYSLGVLLYEIFTHQSFQIGGRESFATLIRQRIDWVAELPKRLSEDLPAGLRRLLLNLIAVEPAQRYGRANEVIKEINKLSRMKFALETEKTLEGYLLSSRFVGREKELALLARWYEKAQRGEGGVVLVTGEAGIGKTRLLREFKVYTQLQRSHSFTGGAYKNKKGVLEPFYGVLKELVNYLDEKSVLTHELRTGLAVLFKIFPDLRNGHWKRGLPRLVPLEPNQERLRNFEALTELIKYLALQFGGLVIFLEDLHWADDLSIQFLEYLGRNVVGSNILICGSARHEELERNLLFKRLQGNLQAEGCFLELGLKPLNWRSLYRFLDSVVTPQSNSSELVQYLLEKTGGNPFFVEEMLRTLLRQSGVRISERIAVDHFKKIALPETIEHLVLKRLEDLDPDCQCLIKFAAVLLKDFQYDLMKRLTKLNDTQLSKALWELTRRKILVEVNNTYQFYHATFRDAVAEHLSHQEKKFLNYRIGKTSELINRGRLETIIDDLAHYFIHAQHLEKGVRYGLRAAKKCSERYANEQAIIFYKGVLGLLGTRDLRRRFEILQKSAHIEAFSGYSDEAIKHYNKAIKLRIGTIEEKIYIFFGITNVYGRRGEFNKVLHVYKIAAKLLKKMKSSKLRDLIEVYINVNICKGYSTIEDYKSVSKINIDATKIPKGLKGKKAIGMQGSIYLAMGDIESEKGEYSKVDYDEVISYYKKAERCFKKIKYEHAIGAGLNNLGVAYELNGDFQKALDSYKRALQISEKIDDPYGVSNRLYNIASVLRTKGSYSKALDCSKKALAVSEKIGNPEVKGYSLSLIGKCYLMLCNYKKAKEYLEKTLRIFDGLDWKAKNIYPMMDIGNVYRAMGDYTFALRYYRKALEMSRAIGHKHKIANLLNEISSLFSEIGYSSKTKRYIDDTLKITRTIGMKDTEMRCYTVLCHSNIIKREYATAKDYYLKGIKIAKAIGMRREMLHLYILFSEICYHETKYPKGIKFADRAIKLARVMGTKDLLVESLLIKIKSEIKLGDLSVLDILKILDEAKLVAEAIGNPELLWKIYYEYGRFLQRDGQYTKALEYYQKCYEIFKDVGSRIKNESYRERYLNRSDRQTVFAAINEIDKILD